MLGIICLAAQRVIFGSIAGMYTSSARAAIGLVAPHAQHTAPVSRLESELKHWKHWRLTKTAGNTQRTICAPFVIRIASVRRN